MTDPAPGKRGPVRARACAGDGRTSGSRFSRRDLLRGGVLLASSGLVGPLQAACLPTPWQTAGPFYPRDWSGESDLDLVQIGEGDPTPGRLVTLAVRVVDLDCRPLTGARVDVWQASALGSYDHPSDPFTDRRDDRFQFRGRALVPESGALNVRTIKPGPYPAGRNWMRPSHIHFRVDLPDRRPFTTQMSFEGDDLLTRDGIVQGLRPEQRQRVIVPFEGGASEEDPLVGTFTLVLDERGREGTPEL